MKNKIFYSFKILFGIDQGDSHCYLEVLPKCESSFQSSQFKINGPYILKQLKIKFYV